MGISGGPPRDGCALVTGGARGIGAACVRALADAGWPVVIHHRSGADLAGALVDEITGEGGAAVAVAGDLTDVEVIPSIYARAENHFGHVAVVVNNAATWSHQSVTGVRVEDWEPVLQTNLTVPLLMSQRALPMMRRARWGRIVNISSGAASFPVPGQASYSASKGGLEALTRAIAAEVARKEITVNAVAPGYIATDHHPDAFQAVIASADRFVPARRAGRADEVAACVRFLASEEASYVNGITLPVDGGLSASAVPWASSTKTRINCDRDTY